MHVRVFWVPQEGCSAFLSSSLPFHFNALLHAELRWLWSLEQGSLNRFLAIPVERLCGEMGFRVPARSQRKHRTSLSTPQPLLLLYSRLSHLSPRALANK
jgi:hypothetical protein